MNSLSSILLCVNVEQQIDCMKNIEESLTASLKTITHFADLLYQERNLLKEEYEDAVDEYKNILQLSRTKFNDKFKSTIQPCIDEALECFQLAVTLLGRFDIALLVLRF